MSTWHQDRARARMNTPLWHPTHFTVVEDGLGKPTSVSRWPTRAEAEAHLAGLKKHGHPAYILDPVSLRGGKT